MTRPSTSLSRAATEEGANALGDRPSHRMGSPMDDERRHEIAARERAGEVFKSRPFPPTSQAYASSVFQISAI